MWPDIKAQYKDAELHIAYGWELYDIITHGNPERVQWKANIELLMQQEGIVHHGRLNKEDLATLRKSCGVWAYPTDFNETNCITALSCQRDGCVPVTMNKGALSETVQSGIKIDGDITKPEVMEEYKTKLIELMGNKEGWQKEQRKGVKFSNTYDWSTIADMWLRAFATPIRQDVKVSIVTPTIRRGFWNIMAHNIAHQTYKVFEWIIVDDYPKDRAHIAKEYAEKYKLNIKYVRGKERATKRHFALANANNTALNAMEGDLMVILQDFILMPEDGIEQLVKVHLTHPQALIAPVDTYYAPAYKPETESEDWFYGKIEIVGEYMRSNIRINGQGLRKTDSPYDFEQNYCAIPRNTIENLGGWYEFMDEGLGFDNTEMACRALQMGYEIWVDEYNKATCIDHWEALKGTVEHGEGREFRLNDPRYFWEIDMIKAKRLPLKRTQEIDDKIELLYTLPKDVKTPDDAKNWIQNEENLVSVINEFHKTYEATHNT